MAASNGWASVTTIGVLVAAGLLLGGFVLIERRSTHPLLPLRLVADGNRGAAVVAMLLAAGALLSMFLFLSYYLQDALGYSALSAGAAFLPFSITLVAGTAITNRLLGRTSSRNLLAPGLLISSVGLLLLTRIDSASTYWVSVLPGDLLVGLGMGLTFVTVASTALIGVGDRDSGVASGLVNTSQQIGGAIGTALLNTAAATVTAAKLSGNGDADASAIAGCQFAFLCGAGLLALGGIAVLLLMTNTGATPPIRPVSNQTGTSPLKGNAHDTTRSSNS